MTAYGRGSRPSPATEAAIRYRKTSLLPTLLTCGNLAAGFLALLAAVRSELLLAAALVSVAALLDLLDGVVARRRGVDDEFGCNLDSLADLVSFGVAPAFALYLGALEGLPIAGPAAGVLFVVCGALRLARFPLVRNSRYFLGLPVPPSGVFVAILAALRPSPVVALLAIVVLSGLMVSRLPFPTLSTLFSAERLRDEHPPSGEP